MWIFTNYGFFSFTQSTYRPGFIQIRARDDRDLSDLRRKHGLRGKIIETENSDYRWRILCRQATAARIMAAEAMDIDYSNFKNAATPRQASRPLMEVWSAMHTVQRARVRAAWEAGRDHRPRHLEAWEEDQATEAAADHDRQLSLFADGTIDEDTEEAAEWVRRRTRRRDQDLEPDQGTDILPEPFEPERGDHADDVLPI